MVEPAIGVFLAFFIVVTVSAQVQDSIPEIDLDDVIVKSARINVNSKQVPFSVSIKNFNGNITTEVFDLIGNKLQNSDETTISLRDYAKGIYILKVAYGDRVEEIKVIKQ